MPTIVKATEKVAGGKLVRLELEHDGSCITRAKITGDFFMHPEEALPDIEHALVGMEISKGEHDFSAKIAKAAAAKAVQMVGFSPETLGRLAMQAITGTSASSPSAGTSSPSSSAGVPPGAAGPASSSGGKT